MESSVPVPAAGCAVPRRSLNLRRFEAEMRKLRPMDSNVSPARAVMWCTPLVMPTV